MREEEKRKKLKDIEGKFDMGNAASSGDTTGLIQTAIYSDAELESYSEINDFGQPKV